MSAAITATDPIVSLIERDDVTATIITDQVNGYDRIIPTPEILDEMGATYAQQIVQADKDWEPIFKEMMAAENTYECRSDKGEVLTLPVAKRVVNQQVAWLTNAILTKSPIIGIKPIDGGSYELPAAIAMGPDGQTPLPPQPVPGMTDQSPQQPFQTETVTAEDAAHLFEALLEYKWTECLPMGQIIEDTVLAIHAGENPTFWRIDYDPKILHARRRKFTTVGENSNVVQIFGVEDNDVVPRDAVKIYHESGYNYTMPVTATDEQTSWWLARKSPKTDTEMWEAIKSRRYDFCAPPDPSGKAPDVTDKIRSIFGFAKDLEVSDIAQLRSQIDNHVASNPRRMHDVRVVDFFHPFLVQRQDGTVAIEIHSCIGELHVDSRQWLSMCRNWSWTGQRLVVPFFRHRRPHRFSGMSGAGDVGPLQSLMSTIFHLQVQNMVNLNLKVFLIRENSATWRYLEKTGNELRPGLRIPFEDPTDIDPVHLGSPVESMAPHITFLDQQAERLMVTSDFDLGVDIPGRTPAATVSQVESMAKMQPTAILRAIRRSMAKAAEFYLQTLAQFNAYETIPFLDPKKKRIVSKLVGFPREMIANHFSFHVTATGDEDSQQARFEKAGMLLKDYDEANAARMQFMQTILDPAADPKSPMKTFAKFCLLGRERLLAEKIQSFALDTQHFIITEDWLEELIASAPPPPPPPPPEEDKPKVNVNVNLKGVLPSDQEEQIAQSSLGVSAPPQGGSNGPQLPAQGAQGQAVQPTPGGLGIVQPQSGNAGVPAPPAPEDQGGGGPVG
jgi:hypothetical protein